MHMIIYFDADKKHYQIVKPDEKKFDKQWAKLAQHITNSNDSKRNYHSIEII